jgi:hypothetical protein
MPKATQSSSFEPTKKQHQLWAAFALPANLGHVPISLDCRTRINATGIRVYKLPIRLEKLLQRT